MLLDSQRASQCAEDETNDSFAGIIQIKFNRMISDQCHVKLIFLFQLKKPEWMSKYNALLATGSFMQFYLSDQLTTLCYLNACLLTLWNVVRLSNLVKLDCDSLPENDPKRCG